MAVKKYGKIKYSKEKKEWLITAEPHVNIRLKDIFRQISKRQIGTLSISHNPQTSKDLEWFLSRYPLDISENDLQFLQKGRIEYDERQDRLEQILMPEYAPKKIELAKPLRPYQSIAADLFISGGSLLCGDDVGLGKTVIAIAGMVGATDSLPAIVVCQTHLPNQWKEKCNEFAPDLKVHTITKLRPYNLPEADVYIISYSKLRGWAEIFLNGFFKMVIFDEIQELRSDGSAKYDAAKILADKASYRLGLSATPVYNYGGEMYNVMNIVKRGCLGKYSEFIREWCDESSYGDKAKVKDPKALGSYLLENFLMIRRTRAEVGRELPPINKVIHEVEYNEDYVEKMEKDLKQIAARVINGPDKGRGEAALTLDVRARMMTGVAKAHGVADYCKILAESGEKFILAGWHREVYEVWMEQLAPYKPVMYTGSETPSQKQKAIKEFTEGDSQVFILSLRSGIGLDGLQHITKLVVFGELDWSPGVHEQVEGRANRDGQQEQVTSIYLVTGNGTDPLMIDTLGLKASQAHGIMNPNNNDIIRVVSNEDRIKDLANQILKK